MPLQMKRILFPMAFLLSLGALPPLHAQSARGNGLSASLLPALTAESVSRTAAALSPRPLAALPAWPPQPGKPPAPQTSFWGKEDLSQPLTVGGKFKRAFGESIFPGLLGGAIAAGMSMATDADLERGYGMGGRGFVRRWGAATAENATDLFMGDFVMASLLRQDPRYHPSAHKGFGRRVGWAISRVFVTQSDKGTQQFNVSHLFGIAAGAAASNAWHHDVNRGGIETGERFGYDLLNAAVANIFREFIHFRHSPRA
jgi:hypothetical protein